MSLLWTYFGTNSPFIQPFKSIWLQNLLPPPQPFSRQLPYLITSVGSSYIICYLAHLRWDTRLIKIALLPFSIGGVAYFWLTIDMKDGDPSGPGYIDIAFIASSAAIRWALSDKTPVKYHPLPKKPFLYIIRRQTWFKAFNLMLMEFRLYGLADYGRPYDVVDQDEPGSIKPKLKSKSVKQYENTAQNEPSLDGNKEDDLRKRKKNNGEDPIIDSAPLQSITAQLKSIIYHFSSLIFNLIIYDLLTFSFHKLDPYNLGDYTAIGYRTLNWDQGINTISTNLGLKGWGSIGKGMTVFLICFHKVFSSYIGMVLSAHAVTIPALLSGLYIPEEYPALTGKPWKSTSLIDLWGKRYHQILQPFFFNYTLPLSFLPHSLIFYRIFFASGIFHTVNYYPYTRVFNLIPNLFYFLSMATGCTLERLYYKKTGKKVGGWKGWLWTASMTIGFAYVLVRASSISGELAHWRKGLAGEKSIVEGLFFKLGWVEDPKIGEMRVRRLL